MIRTRSQRKQGASGWQCRLRIPKPSWLRGFRPCIDWATGNLCKDFRARELNIRARGRLAVIVRPRIQQPPC